ncbi:MAG: hypothetical protein HY937_02820 [Nitrosomonadales bacterium]|nr:hypothetical protein [Nitrosomonadales bacterium]
MFYINAWKTLLATGIWSGEICNRRKSRELYTGRLSIKLLRDESGKVTRHVAAFHEISKRKAAEERKQHPVHYKRFTGHLPPVVRSQVGQSASRCAIGWYNAGGNNRGSARQQQPKI